MTMMLWRLGPRALSLGVASACFACAEAAHMDGSRKPLRRERDHEEHQRSVQVAKVSQTAFGFSPWSAPGSGNVSQTGYKVRRFVPPPTHACTNSGTRNRTSTLS